ncbi:hypothetical protein AB0B97_26170 [Micromonospora sp. NPDC049004]|uniref:hypothetical protein n=1 Tax=Micromonospora sp. NPDC049004 TaxID=3154348 RepID=UPI0033EA1D48
MRTSARRTTASLAAVLIAASAMTLPGSPAVAGEPFQSPDQGLVFYSSYPTEVAGRLATPDGICHQVPADAAWMLTWSGGFRSVPGYQSTDCSGPATELNNFHSWTEGRYLTYRAS